MFRNREDAARQLAERLKGRAFHDPLVLAIPGGGVVVGAVLARELCAELDVVLARKLRAPGQPELAIGAVAETGEIYLDPHAQEMTALTTDYLAEERRLQFDLLGRRRRLFRGVRPAAPAAGRSVIVTNDCIATGSMMMAALRVVNARSPREVIVAVPVASPEPLEEVRQRCAEVVSLLRPHPVGVVGQFYEDFSPVDDEQARGLLRGWTRASGASAGSGPKASAPEPGTFGRIPP
jgi:putative phosphoribosyl transferase